jgi:hypothetical protein
MAVFVDDRADDLEELILSDDGTGSDISIPSILLSKLKGDEIITFYESNNHEAIQVLHHFDLNREDNRVEYEIWGTSSDEMGQNFIKEFEPFYKLLGQDALLTP